MTRALSLSRYVLACGLVVVLCVTSTSAQETLPQPADENGDPFRDDESSASDVEVLPAPAGTRQPRTRSLSLNNYPELTYVVVSSDGRSSLLQGDPLITYYCKKLGPRHRLIGTRAILPVLIRDGWTIVRETSMGTKYSGALILLKRPAPAAPTQNVGQRSTASSKLAAAAR